MHVGHFEDILGENRAGTINRLTEYGYTSTVNRLHFLLTVNRCKQFLVIIHII